MAETVPNIRDCFRYDVPSRNAICRVSRMGILCRTKISNNHQIIMATKCAI